MSSFSTQVQINAPADEVFAYVTDFDNMADYLPTVDKASPAGEGHIRMQGEVNGHAYDTTGWFQVHEFNRTMLWGAKGANDYSGDLEVMDQGQSCVLSINLKFDELPDLKDEDRKRIEAHLPEIKKGLEESGQRIKQRCESAFAPADAKNRGYAI